jgi:hypothetical protein
MWLGAQRTLDCIGAFGAIHVFKRECRLLFSMCMGMTHRSLHSLTVSRQSIVMTDIQAPASTLRARQRSQPVAQKPTNF